MTETATTPDSPERRPVERRFDRDKPRPHHSVFLRMLEMPDGRKLMLDKRAIAFLCEGKPEEFGGKRVTIVAFKTNAKACPVTAGFHDLAAWWKGDAPAGNGKAAP